MFKTVHDKVFNIMFHEGVNNCIKNKAKSKNVPD